MQLISIDFETHYSKEYSLSKLTTEEYIRDDRFEVIGVSVKVGEGAAHWFSGTHDETAVFLAQFDWANSMVLAHNCSFDAAILNWCFDIRPRALADTLSMGNALGNGTGSVSLAALVQKYGLGEKGTEVINALGKRRADFTPVELASYGRYCVNDTEICCKLFHKMIQDGFPVAELKLIDTTLRMFTEPVFELDLPMLETHLEDVVSKKQALLDACGIDKDILMSNPKLAAKLEELGVKVPTKISKTTGKETYALAKTDEAFRNLPETLAETMAEDSPILAIVESIVAARLGAKSTLEETRTQRLIDIAKRGKLPVPIKYCGAFKTKRWSGEGGGINMQNLPRKSKLKAAIRAPEGHVVVGADLSNIELRIGLWFGGMNSKLALLRGGLDLYKDFAASAFGVPYDQVNADQRFMGKTSQLSLIYGVGANKLREAILTGSQLFLNKRVDIGEVVAIKLVSLYRTQYHGVVDAWNQGGRALEAVLRDQYMEFGPNGVIQVHGRKGLLLPSGLYIQYPGLTKSHANNKTVWSYRSRKGEEHIYSAKIYQACIQSLARCQMADGMLRTRKRYPVALTVHDAEYFVVPEDEGQAALDFAIEQLCIPPSWAPDLPLAAEGGFGYTLKDCK